LVGCGRENFNFTDTGNGTNQNLIDGKDGNTPYWLPSSTVRTIMNTTYWQESTSGVMVQRFNVGDAYRYTLTSTNVPFNWSLFLGGGNETPPSPYTGVVTRYGSTTWWSASVTYTLPSTTYWTDTYFDNGNLNDERRCFTWPWSGHNYVRGFSAGGSITNGYQYTNEAHAIQRVNVFVRVT